MRWRSSMITIVRNVAVIGLCVLAGMTFARWYEPVTSTNAFNGESRHQQTERAIEHSVAGGSSRFLASTTNRNSSADDEAPREVVSPTDAAAIQFMWDLSAASAAVRDLEVRWDRTDRLSKFGDDRGDEWYQELDKIKSQLQSMDQSSEAQNAKIKTERTFSPERIEK